MRMCASGFAMCCTGADLKGALKSHGVATPFGKGILMPRMQEGIPGSFSGPPQETAFEVDNLQK